MTLSQVTQVEPEPLYGRLMGVNTAETDIKELHVCLQPQIKHFDSRSIAPKCCVQAGSAELMLFLEH